MDAIVAGRYDYFGQSPYYLYRSYIKFDLSEAPFFDRPILNADLRPWNYITTMCGAEAGNIAVRRITSDWSLGDGSNALRWNNQPSVTSRGQGVKGSGVGKIQRTLNDVTYCPDPAQEVYYSIEGIVQDWADGAQNYGVQVASFGEAGGRNYREYLSSEWTGSDGRGPVLFVEYEAPEEVEIAYERDGLPDDSLPSYEEVLENQIPLSEAPPAPEPVTITEAGQRQASSPQTVSVDPDSLPTEQPEPDDEQPDTIPPALVAKTPDADTQDVRPATHVTLFFSEPVTGQQVVLKTPDGESVAGSIQRSPRGDIIEFIPTQTLQPGTTFQVQVSGAQDAAGNIMAPLTWSFTTLHPDRTAPTITETLPRADATDVPHATPIEVTFSEPVDHVQMQISAPSGDLLQGTISASADRRQQKFILERPLAAETRFTVTVSGAADEAGNTMSAYSWSFTTGKADTSSPIITQTFPEKDASAVPPTVAIRAIFDEPVTGAGILIKDETGATVSGVAQMEGSTVLTFSPSRPLAEETRYRAEVAGAKDSSGNLMHPFSWSFTTRDAEPPQDAPTLMGEYASPTSGNGGTATTLTPMFTGYIDDPAGRPGVMTVQVEHAPEVPGQGSGLDLVGYQSRS
ncbi:Ig-like domain-containing protein [Spongiactinospora rosea]|nr:Ig-like domain-containing protein [Spongiactinospora rosea]